MPALSTVEGGAKGRFFPFPFLLDSLAVSQFQR
jgi:hypothetical protein